MMKKRTTPCTCRVATMAKAEISTKPALRVFSASGIET
jgi:hypothetical protein